MKQNLFRSWTDLAKILEIDTPEIERMWDIFVNFYEQSHRSYHNLNHLAQMFALTEEMLVYISDPISFKLAIWFHDIIYQPTRKDNELVSSQKAEVYMKAWNISPESIIPVVQYIQSTAKHIPINGSDDEKLFLDIDLSILGREPHIYQAYTQAIRKEYNMYPSLIYKYGRRKSMKKFLKRPRIYFSDMMYERFEVQARTNIEKELGDMG